MAATSSPKKFPRGQPKSYSTCLLYNTKEASQKLQGLTFAACNPKLEKNIIDNSDNKSEKKPADEPLSIKVSDKMLCSLCDVVFVSRSEQKSHYKSDWHRYNIKQRLKGKLSVNEENFDEISGNVSSISGSDSDSDLDSDASRTTSSADFKSRKPVGIPSHLTSSGNTSTDSESEGGQVEDAAQRLPKVYFRTAEGELVSIYRCVLCHKRWQPTKPTDLLSLAEELPEHMMWALFMAGGGHFAGAIFNKGNLVAHKTFHRYVVRAKRGTAQGSRDSQGNAPKSAGASLRRYNEAALTQDIQDLITSWDEHIKLCDKIFLRAPSFNRKIFFGGKTPPFKKDDMRIRLIPFQTRRPTFNEIRRVYELLASIECYGDESEIQNFIPISPPQVFNAETGQLSLREENQLSPRRRKMKNKLSSASPLVFEGQEATDKDGSELGLQASEGSRSETLGNEELIGRQPEIGYARRQCDPGQENVKLALPDYLTDPQNSTGTSTGSESELVEQMETVNLLELKEFFATKKPKKRKKPAKKRKNSLRCQKSPESNVFEEEKYHLKNNLYTACKIGDLDSLRNLLAIFSVRTLSQSQKETEKLCDKMIDTGDQAVDSSDQIFSMINDPVNACNFVGNTDANFKNANETMELVTANTVDTSNNYTSRLEQLDHTENDDVIRTTEEVLSSDIKDKNVIIQTNTNVTLVDFSKFNDNLDAKAGDIQIEDKSAINGSSINVDKESDKKDVGSDVDGLVTDKRIENFTEPVGKDAKDVTDGLVNESIVNSDGRLVNEDLGHTNIIDGLVSESENVNTVQTNPALPLNVSSTSQVLGSNLPDLSPVVTVSILSETFGDNETTLLHVAAREGHKDIITLLMTAGADPAIRDRAGLTPYMVSKDKPTRNEFRRFMGQWPEKYDYARAQIPPPLSEEQENEKKRKEAERKKAQKKAKQERQKEKQAEEAAREAEEREKKRFLGLSEREKRALAAERRLLDQASKEGASKPVLSRCWQCGEDMSGRVPFEYMDYKFCTSKCLQIHRKQKTTK